VNYLYLGLLFLALAVIEVLQAGTRFVFSLPSYTILSLAGISTLLSFRRPQFPANMVCLLGSALFFGYLLFRILTSPVEYLARADFFSVLGGLVVYLLVAFFLTAPKQRLWLLLGLLVIGLVHVGIGVLQYIRREHFQIFSFIQPPADYGARASGFYGCPDHLAGYLEVVALMGLSVACWSRWPIWLKVCAGYLSLMCFAGILLTGSRGGYLSTGFGFLVFIGLSLMTLRKGVIANKWPLAIGTIVVAGLVLTGMIYFISSQFSLRTRWANVVEQGGNRLEMWGEAIEQFKLNPVVGTGSGSYLYYQRHFRKSSEWRDAIYVHNDYLHLLAEYGIIGFAAFAIFLGVHVASGIRSFNWFTNERMNSLGRIRSDTLALNIGALSGLSTYLVHSFFDFNLHVPANALLMAIPVALLANPGVDLPFKSARFHKTNRYLRLALPALAVWLAVASLPRLPAEYFAEQARLAFGRDQFAATVSAANAGIGRDRRNPFLYWYLGQGYFALGETAPNPEVGEVFFKLAAQAYSNSLPLFPQDRYLLLGMGWSLDALKRFDEAEPYFKEVVTAEPNSAQIRAFYASHLHSAGKLDQAEQEYNNSMKLYWNVMAHNGLERLAKERKVSGQ